MNARSFWSDSDFDFIKRYAGSRENFTIKKQCKEKRNRYEVTIDGRHIFDEKLIRDIWHGHDYLLGFHVDYHGDVGIGGAGFAVDTFPMLESWEAFKAWFDKLMKRYPEYELEEYGQLSLWG